MTRSRRNRLAVLPVALGLVLLSIPAAQASICFTAFGGAVSFVFNGAKIVKGTRIAKSAVTGRIFGPGVGACAGLAQWPVYGSVSKSSDGSTLVVGFTASLTDAASSGCGPIEFTGELDPVTLTGPFSLYNSRADFTNSDTLTKVDCSPAFLESAAHSAPPQRGTSVLGVWVP